MSTPSNLQLTTIQCSILLGMLRANINTLSAQVNDPNYYAIRKIILTNIRQYQELEVMISKHSAQASIF